MRKSEIDEAILWRQHSYCTRAISRFLFFCFFLKFLYQVQERII